MNRRMHTAYLCFVFILFTFLEYIPYSKADCSLSTTSVSTFGIKCQHMCHCKNGASCDEDTGGCNVGCDTNWFGPACQYRDLAETQFSRHNSNKNSPQYSFQAHDGVNSTCSYTQVASQSTERPWWRVWFPRNETIRDIYILTLDGHRRYFSKFEVIVEYVPENKKTDPRYAPTFQHTCYQHSNTEPGNADIRVQCNQPIVGNQVRIKLWTTKSQLVLCDVRINAGRNFAFRKSVTASHSNNNNPPTNAVDGRFASTVSTDWSGCFASTTTDNPYLGIDLGHSIYAYSVNINTRSDDNISGYKIYNSTDLQLVYDDTGHSPPVTYIHLNTNVQQLRIQRNSTNQLVICELDIYGECPANKCGYDCSENCYCNSREDIDQRISGVCTTGCQVRWTGLDLKCNIECDEKKWGTQCQNDCGACRIGTCDVVSGYCTGGCLDGYQYTDDCTTECQDGKYGQNCKFLCSQHCMNGSCNKTNGACLGGCKAGYTGDKCDQECPEGKYGINCNLSCSANCEDVCNHVQGTCTTCKAGWKGDYCYTECDDGTFGIGCAQNCVSACASRCDKVNGYCLTCPPGWKGNFCEAECTDGRYGSGCEYECSDHCVDLCNKYNGSCTCSTGWQGQMCHDECDEKKWGTQCQNDCGACRIGTCDVVSGYCTGGCQDGYQYTDDCTTECLDGKYGQSCQSSCSQHCMNGSCNKTNGACLGGCTGAKCDQVELTQQDNTIVIAGSVVAGIVVICVTVIIVVCTILRRKSPLPHTSPSNQHANLNDPVSLSYEDLQRDCNEDKTDDTYDSIVQDGINNSPSNQHVCLNAPLSLSYTCLQKDCNEHETDDTYDSIVQDGM